MCRCSVYSSYFKNAEHVSLGYILFFKKKKHISYDIEQPGKTFLYKGNLIYNIGSVVAFTPDFFSDTGIRLIATARVRKPAKPNSILFT